MRSAGNSSKPPFPPPVLDLEVYSETTRSVLYHLVVAVHFTAPAEIEPGDWYPDYTPEEAGLGVYFLHHRWLAGWMRIEEADSTLPAARRQALVRIQADPSAPLGVAFYEV